jgi:Ulp1 family protease
MDSLGNSRTPAMKNLKEYLACEAKERHGIEVDINDKSTIISMAAKIPQQPNHCDCGVYLLQFVDHFFAMRKDCLKTILVRPKLTKMRRDAQDWFSIDDIRQKRVDIRALIEKVQGEYSVAKGIVGDAKPNKIAIDDDDDEDVQIIG